MNDEKIVISRPLPGDAVGLFRDAGFPNVWCPDRDETLPRDRLLEAVRGAHALITFPGDKGVNAEVFDAAGEQLRIVSNFAVGVDNIDLDEAAKRTIIVGHTPNAVTEPTADIAWLLLLGAARRAHEGEQLARSGQWKGIGPADLLGHRIVGKTLLVIGAGRIGSAMACRSIGWRMRVLYFDTQPNEELEREPVRASRIDLDEGLKEADFISLHTPYTPQTHHLLNAARLELLRETAVLVNTSRGKCIDESALVDALKQRRIAAAGLDVYENEPQLAPGLTELDNVFLMPHIGSATHEDRQWMTEIAVNNVIAALRDEEPPHVFGG
jgi:lactate dehydrogenase-like 2-hydroxyacid dehydrogenase